jgi:hypothetical protein
MLAFGLNRMSSGPAAGNQNLYFGFAELRECRFGELHTHPLVEGEMRVEGQRANPARIGVFFILLPH